MKSPLTKDAWYCDICGGFFTIEDAGHLSKDNDGIDSCEECHSQRWDTSENETIN